MATEVGSDIALIQDEDMLRKMWQQTEDFGKKKEIRMRMYKLREQRLKEFYTTGEMIQTETTTSKRSSTRTHTESITDQGFMTMKTKEIRDSESPTEDYHRQSNTNKNYYVSSKADEPDGSRRVTDRTTSAFSGERPDEEYGGTVHTSRSHSAAAKWESSRTTVSVSEEVRKCDVHAGSKTIAGEQYDDSRQLTYGASSDKQNSANATDGEATGSTNVDGVRREDGHRKAAETYTSDAADGDPVGLASENLVSNKSSTRVDSTRASDVSTGKSEHVEIAINTDNTIINELHQLDSHSSARPATTADASTRANPTASHDEQPVKRVDDQITDSSMERVEGPYTTTYQHSYQPPRISVDLSPSHEAFARSLRSTPERSSPSPGRERTSPERRLKSVSPEKRRASPEKSASPPKSIKSPTRRKLSSTLTKDLSKKRANTPTRVEKYDSSDDSDCSGATHGTYDKYRGYDAKRSLFKEETKISSTSKYGQKSPSTSPVRREKSPGYSSEGSVGKEVRKSSFKVKNSSHESSPERSAFKPVQNYKAPQTQHVTQNSKINLITEEDNNYSSKNNAIDTNNFIKVIKPESEDDLNTNEYTETTTQNTVNNIRDLKNKSIQEKFIVEEQITTSSERTNKVKIEKHNTEVNRANRESKSPSKVVKKENNLNQQKFIENEKLSGAVKENKKANDVMTSKPKEKSPVKDAGKPVAKGTTAYSRVKSSEKILQSSNSKTDTPTRSTTSAVPSSIKKTVPSGLEKTPSKRSLVHKDSKENVTHKAVRKDDSREKVDVKMARDNSRTLVHKSSNGSIARKTLVKKPGRELIKDRKPAAPYSKVRSNGPETRPKAQNPTTKVAEKKDPTNKSGPSVGPQSSRNKPRAVGTSGAAKTITDSGTSAETANAKKTPSAGATGPKTFASARPNATRTDSSPAAAGSRTGKAARSSPEATGAVEVASKGLEDESPPDAFDSDTDLDDSGGKPAYVRRDSSGGVTSSSSSSSEDGDGDDDGKRKIRELDDIRVEAEQEYGKKMTNNDALLNVVVQLPQSSRESSPELNASKLGQPYCSASDDASSCLPRYADAVTEPEDGNDYRAHGKRYDVVTDLDEAVKTTVADRVSKFLNDAGKRDGIKTADDVPHSPQAVRRAKRMFESMARGRVEPNDGDGGAAADGSKVTDAEVRGPRSPPLTRRISGASDYRTRKEFFEGRRPNAPPEDARRPAAGGNARRQSSGNGPPSGGDVDGSPDRTAVVVTQETGRSGKPSGSKHASDGTAAFEQNGTGHGRPCSGTDGISADAGPASECPDGRTAAGGPERTATTGAKAGFGVTARSGTSATVLKTTTTTTVRSTATNAADDEVQIEDIFDLHVLEMMLEKAVGYDRRRRIRAQIRVVKRELETKSVKETAGSATRVLKNTRGDSPVKHPKQRGNATAEKPAESVRKTETAKKQRSPSPRKPYGGNPAGRSPSPQKTLRSVEETRSPLPQGTVRPTEKARSPSPKKTSVVKQQQQQQESRTEKSFRHSTVTSATVTTTTKVRSEQTVGTSVFQEQNVTDLITSSYGVGPTDDNGRPLFGLRALRKTNQTIAADDSHAAPAVIEPRSSKTLLFGSKTLKNDDDESTNTVVRRTKVSEREGGVDQLITDHKGKPLFGLRALQSVGKPEDDLPVYEDMPEPPVSPQLKELVLKHEKHAKESSKSDAQPRQKPKAKFRDSFILDTKDEGLYSEFEQNGLTEPSSITLRSIIKRTDNDRSSNETVVKSKSQSTVFQSKSVVRSDGSGNVSVTQDFLKGEVSSAGDEKPSGKLTRGRYTYRSPVDHATNGVAKVTTVAAAVGEDAGPEITEVTEELVGPDDRVDGDRIAARRSRANDKFGSIQKRFSQDGFDRDGGRSSSDTNGYDRPDGSPRSTTPRSSLVRGDSIKALQHKFQQATVSSSLKQNRPAKSGSSGGVAGRADEKPAAARPSDASRRGGAATSFLDDNSRVTGVQDVLTRMRNADLVVETGDTTEDIEARALLNKFLGASVILHGMEQGGKSSVSRSATTTATTMTTTSASLVNQVEKQRAQKTSPVAGKTPAAQRPLDDIWDEKRLQILLESCPDYDQRRQIRARLRQIMAEHKACADVVADADGAPDGQTTHGELSLQPVSSLGMTRNAATPATVDDSGTESGEEANQRILVQVRGALANLETALPALDPVRRSSVAELLAKLQASLKPTPPPRKCWNKKAPGPAHARHTVGVSCEELQHARRWLEENGYATPSQPPQPPQPQQPPQPPQPPQPQAAAPKTFRPVRFVPPPPRRAHCVPEPQRAVVENVDDDDTSGSSSRCSSAGIGPSDDDDDDDDGGRPVSSARRLLQFAAAGNDGRAGRHGKRAARPRRADGERSSGDECDAPPRTTSCRGGVPPFRPRTVSDQKYVALLRLARDDEAAASHGPRNPLNGKPQGNWSGRFGRIKTAFERGAAPPPPPPPMNKGNAAKKFWHDICKCPSDDSIACRPTATTAFKPNGFSHATRSAFKPVAAPHGPSAAFLEPPAGNRPLYNSSVATAHRPFVCASSSSSSQSDLTAASRSASPYSADAAPLQQRATVSRIMGSPQTATVTAKGKATTTAAAAAAAVRSPRPPPRSPRLVPQQRSPATSPVRMPSVLQKSESWHQMIMGQSRAASRDDIARKQDMVRERLSRPSGGRRPAGRPSPGANPVVELDDDMDKVDDTFESLFKESTKTGSKKTITD